MEREVGGGIGMGNTCKPLAVSFQCMTKSTTNKKKKKKDGKLDMLLGVSSRRVLEEESFEQVLKSRRDRLCFSSARNTVHVALSPRPSDLRLFDCLT